MLFPLLRIAVRPQIVRARLRASLDLPETLALRPQKIRARVSRRGQNHYARGLRLKATDWNGCMTADCAGPVELLHLASTRTATIGSAQCRLKTFVT
jgi:hypothetical protein